MRTEWLNVNIVMHTKDRFVSMQKSQLGLGGRREPDCIYGCVWWGAKE